jgi:hypothetical protein
MRPAGVARRNGIATDDGQPRLPRRQVADWPDERNEFRKVSELFQLLRGIIDRGRRQGKESGRFLLLGSAAMDLLKQSGESLAGRISTLEFGPFDAAAGAGICCSPAAREVDRRRACRWCFGGKASDCNFFSNEGSPREPVHVHAEGQGAEAKFWLFPEVRVAESTGFDRRALADPVKVVEQRKDEIERAWHEHFG